MIENNAELFSLIGQRIKDARLAQHLSQADLARKAELPLPRISMIENGKSDIRVSTFVSLIEALQVSADDILRPNTPAGLQKFQGELFELTQDCSPAELKSLLEIIKNIKSTMWSDRSSQE